MNEKIKALVDEFASREATERLRSAVRLRADIPDQQVVYENLARWMDEARRRRGLRIKDFVTMSDVFDFGNKVGFAVDMRTEKDPDARPMFFVCYTYERMYLDEKSEREKALDLIASILKKRKVKTIREAIRRATE